MLPNLTIIISVYCCVRLMEMMSSSAVPKLKAFWAFVCIIAIAIIGFFCFDTVRRGGSDPTSSSFRGSTAFGDSTIFPKDLFEDVDRAFAEPRISRGANGPGDSALRGSLSSLRDAIDMYAAEHGGTFPGNNAGACDAALLKNQLTLKSKFDGTTGTGAGFDFGPYLRKGFYLQKEFPPAPVGPQAGKASGVEVTAASPPVADETKTDKGWVYNCVTGEIVVNTDDSDGVGGQYDRDY